MGERMGAMDAILMKADWSDKLHEFPGFSWETIQELITSPEVNLIQVRLKNGKKAMVYKRGEYEATEKQLNADVRMLNGEYF